VSISVKMDFIEVMGASVVDKDLFCIHWSMRGLRGRESSGDTENVRAAVSGNESYPVARFNEIFSGDVHVRPRKDGSGYDVAEFDMRVCQPALHKKDEKILGKALVNIFEKVPTLTKGQPASFEQTAPLTKDGSAVAHLKVTLLIGEVVPTEEAEATEKPAEPEQVTSPTTEAEPRLLVTPPPASPSKDAGSESGTAAEVKDDTTSKKSHRKRRSSVSNSMAAETLKKKEEEFKKKEEAFEEEKKELNGKIAEKDSEIDELKKENSHLSQRVKELELAKEQTDVVPINPEEEKMQEQLRTLQEESEKFQERQAALLDEQEQNQKKIAELNEALESKNKELEDSKKELEDSKKELEDSKKELEQSKKELEDSKKELEEAKNQPAPATDSAAAPSDDSKDKELALLKDELASLKEELSKKNAAPAPAKNNMMMQAIIGAAGAVIGIIIGLII